MKFDVTKLSQEMGRIQEEFAQAMQKIRVEGSAGGGMVKVVADGQGNILSVKIEPELLKGEVDIELLQDLIVAAVNETKNNAKAEAKKEMQKIIGFPTSGFLPDNLF
jgi:DNA-binding YbaB/EbfC family protein